MRFRFVRAVGLETARIAPAVVATLLASAERIHFFDLRDVYRVIENPDGSLVMVSDLPTTFVTITVNGRTKRVEDYLGAPDGLAQFEREIDEAARTRRWIFLDEETSHLFAVLKLDEGHTRQALPEHPLMRRWWNYMRDLMETHPDGRPLEWPLVPVFHQD